MKNYYTISSTEEFINSMVEKHGYSIEQLREGILGLGDMVLIAPNENQYNFVIREIALNCWSSAQTIRKCRKISVALQKEIEKAAS